MENSDSPGTFSWIFFSLRIHTENVSACFIHDLMISTQNKDKWHWRYSFLNRGWRRIQNICSPGCNGNDQRGARIVKSSEEMCCKICQPSSIYFSIKKSIFLYFPQTPRIQLFSSHFLPTYNLLFVSFRQNLGFSLENVLCWWSSSTVNREVYSQVN